MRISKYLVTAVLASVLLTTGAGCFGGSSTPSAAGKVTLEVWGVFDEDDAWKDVIDGYRAVHPNVTVEYTKLRFEEYKDDLVRAIAEGKGPDVFAVHNDWLGEFATLLEPMPEAVTVAHVETQGTVRKETVLVTTSESTMSMKTLKANFIPAVVDGVVMPFQEDEDTDPVDKIYALPMGVDTLGLFYNQDMLNAAGIPQPPATWEDFQRAVMLLTKLDPAGAVVQSGVGLGTSKNVERAADILSVLMMQNGANMVDDRGRVTFNDIPAGTPRDVNPGVDAVRFYTDFANPTKEVYTWNASQSSSLEAFVNGKAAMFLGYSYHLPIIRTLAPKLNVGVAALPQISVADDVQQVNFVNYWAQGVSRDSKNTDYAWNFILYATDEKNVPSYLAEAGKPTALRNLISGQREDEDLGVFVDVLLTAKTWYRGKDIDATEAAMNRLIDDILVGTYEEPQDALDNAAKVVRQTY
jgi:ABC-type glycerol-3-phosphate transport system substrate-binding protein